MAPHKDTTSTITQDRMLGGRVVLRQPGVGYRAGLDAALLAACVEAAPGQRVIEAGCGVGAALLQAAERSPGAQFTGVERDVAAQALAQENAALNGLGGRVSAICADVGQPFSALALPPFDIVFCNPPFFDDPQTLRGPHPARRDAYIAKEGLEAWIRFLIQAVRPNGRVVIIHRADRLADLLRLLGTTAGSIRIRPVQPFADQPAKRILLRATKAGRAPLVLLPSLVLHDHQGAKHTAAAEAILRGEAALGWD